MNSDAIRTIEEDVQLVLEELVNSRERQFAINDLLVKRGYLRGTLNEMMVDIEKFERLLDVEKCAILIDLFSVTKDKRIEPKKFFDEKTVSKCSKFKRKVETNEVLPYTFKNYVLRYSESDYITQMSYKELTKLWNSKIITYNYDLQRKPKEKISKEGKITKTPKVSQLSVEQITELIKGGKFRSNAIVLNILIDGNDNISYDQETLELTVFSGRIDIIDGFHRLSAILNVLEENKNFEGYIDVSIKYLTESDAKQFLGQINKINLFDKTYVRSLMNHSVSDRIVTELNKKSGLHERITTDTGVSKNKTYLTNFAIMSQAIEDAFQPKDNRDRIDITEMLINFFDYLIDYYKDDFSEDIETLKEARERSLINYHNSFVAHVFIAKALYDRYGKNIPSDEIIRAISLIDWSFDGEYGEIFKSSGKQNSNQLKRRIVKYIQDKMLEL